jgi:hypothetical protein
MARTMSPLRCSFRKQGVPRAAGAGLLLLLTLARPLLALSLEKEFGNNVLYTELSDPYYFSSGLYLSLLKSPIPALGAIGEKPVYRRLLSNLFKPNCLLFEVGAYPLPLAGVAAKAWAPRYYGRSQIMGTNVIKLLTESVNFKEPWSFSFFCGNMVFFKETDGSVDGHGNIGLLATYGYYHIKDNSLIPDHWGEFEVKIKVDKNGSDRQYGISYRAGARLHSNAEIKDFLYLGFNRNRTDFSEPSFSFYKNVNVQIRGDCSVRPLEILALSAEAGKKKPFKWHKRAYAVGLSLGATWNINNAYSVKLGEGFIKNSVTAIIKPMLNF